MGLKIPRSKGRAGSIPASGTKQIKGLHAFGVQALCFLFRNSESCSAIPDSTNFYQAGKSEKPIAESTQATQQPMTEKKAL